MNMRKKKARQYRKHDWREIRDTFITKPQSLSLRKLAREFDVSVALVSRKAKKEGWEKRRQQHLDKVSSKVYQDSTKATAFTQIKALQITESLIGIVLNALKGSRLPGGEGEKKEKMTIGEMASLMNSSDKLLRLRELLQGHPDTRPGDGITFEDFVRKLRKQRAREHKNIQIIEAEATLKELDNEPGEEGK